MAPAFSHGYALFVGVGETAYKKWSLPVTVKDAEALQAVFADSNRCAFPADSDHIRLLHDDTASREGILKGLRWLAKAAKKDPDATVVVYYSGHGWIHVASGRYYLIPHDIDALDVPGSALDGEKFTAALRAIEARRLLVVLDCCHAAGMATAKDGETPLTLPSGMAPVAASKDLVDDLARGAGRAVFLSSRGEEKSWVRPDGSLSIYTHHLIEALNGAGNLPGDTMVHLSNLAAHLRKTVSASAMQAHKARQTPFFKWESEDFPVAALAGGKGLPAGGWAEVRTEVENAMRRIVVHQTNIRASKRGIAANTVHGGIHQYNYDKPGDEDDD